MILPSRAVATCSNDSPLRRAASLSCSARLIDRSNLSSSGSMDKWRDRCRFKQVRRDRGPLFRFLRPRLADDPRKNGDIMDIIISSPQRKGTLLRREAFCPMADWDFGHNDTTLRSSGRYPKATHTSGRTTRTFENSVTPPREALGNWARENRRWERSTFCGGICTR